MKDSLFEMLMSFFEKSLSELKESNLSDLDNETDSEEGDKDKSLLFIRAARDASIRVFTYEEQIKFTKASYQFLMKLMLWGIIASETMEQILNQLLFSESRFVTLQETKWTIRNCLADSLSTVQLAFLDLVLYQKEDELPLH
ncbi:Protein Smg [Legionella birminghamensis]|uniref:Protein Smg n=1 Tax=Legionella birminghamensis TaxID=28083 RepID=A0A378I7P3_9GAMM|nr:DUF494 family protein [Legionella birminghamensis]KTC72509.1 Protein Smg [Legionella birminghamensis]STX30641.1 Uncharacterized protein conserved in bacteria [Legionella birminghamensis]